MKQHLTRRDFLRTAAATAAVGSAVHDRRQAEAEAVKPAAAASDNAQAPALPRIDSHAHGWYKGRPEAIGDYLAECRRRGVERIVLIQSCWSGALNLTILPVCPQSIVSAA